MIGFENFSMNRISTKIEILNSNKNISRLGIEKYPLPKWVPSNPSPFAWTRSGFKNYLSSNFGIAI